MVERQHKVDGVDEVKVGRTSESASHLSRYPAYKDSGVPWLGEIPAHWELRKTKYLFEERSEKGFPDEPLLAATQTKGVVRKEEYENRTVLALKDLHLLKLVRVGDFVISLRSFQGGIEFARHQGIISPAYTILYPINPDHQPFYGYLFKSRPYVQDLSLFVTGIRQGQNIDYQRLKNSPLPVPPPDEQRAIARFLEAIDRLTRRYISAQRRLIALLTEQKQALIQQAVTRGLNPDAPLKDSGIEWLGEIPAHWETIYLKHVATVQTGLTLGKDYGSLSLEERPYLRVANVQDGFLDLSFITTIRVPQSEIVRCELQTGDILMTEGGDRDKLGRGYIWHGEISGCLHQNHIFAVRVNVDRLLPEYLILLMTSPYGRRYFELTAKQTTNLASTNTTKLKAFPLLLPSVEEQKRIAEYVAQQSSGLVSAITRTQRQIELVREYRTRLIADVVTGKLDVRGVEVGRTSESASHLDLEDETDFEEETEEITPDEEVLDE